MSIDERLTPIGRVRVTEANHVVPRGQSPKNSLFYGKGGHVSYMNTCTKLASPVPVTMMANPYAKQMLKPASKPVVKLVKLSLDRALDVALSLNFIAQFRRAIVWISSLRSSRTCAHALCPRHVFRLPSRCCSHLLFFSQLSKCETLHRYYLVLRPLWRSLSCILYPYQLHFMCYSYRQVDALARPGKGYEYCFLSCRSVAGRWSQGRSDAFVR